MKKLITIVIVLFLTNVVSAQTLVYKPKSCLVYSQDSCIERSTVNQIVFGFDFKALKVFGADDFFGEWSEDIICISKKQWNEYYIQYTFSTMSSDYSLWLYPNDGTTRMSPQELVEIQVFNQQMIRFQ